MAKVSKKKRIQYRIRKKVSGTPGRPRLSIFRSNKGIYCQIIDDTTGTTLASCGSEKDSQGNMDQAKKVGQEIASKASSLDISEVVFDRGGYLFHGRIKALADAAREAGLKF